MNELEQIRCSIDLIDSQLAVLFEARMKEVAKIAEYKALRQMPIYDPERESQIRPRNASLIKTPEFRPYFDKFYDRVIELSKEYQQKAHEK